MIAQSTNFKKLFVLLSLCFFFSCSASEIISGQERAPAGDGGATFNYLALGDSYTVGESVTAAASFPAQLVVKLNEECERETSVDILATTGWRTDELLDAMKEQEPNTKYDIVTLLIGVNNQYQNRLFAQYETEFTLLLNNAISLAKGESDGVFVISIPDYAFTPFAANADRETISIEIDRYNDYAKETAAALGVRFINITDITRMGLNEPELVASDGLHPSWEAYRRFVERLLPFERSRLQ